MKLSGKITAIDKYNLNPNLCLHCGKVVPYKKNIGLFCNRDCSNKGKSRKYESKVFDFVNWKEVQERHNNGILLSEIPREFNFSYTTLLKAIKLGLFKVVNTEIHNNKRRKSASLALKKAHSEGRHIGWGHINNKKERSYPEEFFVKVLKKNGIWDKYKVLEKVQVNKYTLDFVLVELKLNIEIDGQQHFRNEKSIEHDKKRNDFLIRKGWKVYRIAWIEMIKNPKKEIDLLLSYLKKEKNNSSRFYNISEVINKVKIKKYNSFDEYNKDKHNIYLRKNKDKIDLVLKSEIDFSKYGWGKEVSKLIGILPQKANGWIKKYMPEIYKKCFKKIDRLGLSKVRKYGSRKDYKNGLIKLSKETTDSRIEVIKNNGIVLFEKGWCSRLMRLLNLSKNGVISWINKNEKYILSKLKK